MTKFKKDLKKKAVAIIAIVLVASLVFPFANESGEVRADTTVKDEAITKSESSLEKLFTDDRHTKLRLLVVEKDIKLAQKWINIVSNESHKKELQKELDKAQKLMEKVDPNFTIEPIAGKTSSKKASKIVGKSVQPNTLLHFAGSKVFPEAKLKSDNPDSKKLYHVRTDEKGEFQFKLPEGKQLEVGEVIQARSELHGKTEVKKTVVGDEERALNRAKKVSTFSDTEAPTATVVHRVFEAKGMSRQELPEDPRLFLTNIKDNETDESDIKVKYLDGARKYSAYEPDKVSIELTDAAGNSRILVANTLFIYPNGKILTPNPSMSFNTEEVALFWDGSRVSGVPIMTSNEEIRNLLEAGIEERKEVFKKRQRWRGRLTLFDMKTATEVPKDSPLYDTVTFDFRDMLLEDPNTWYVFYYEYTMTVAGMTLPLMQYVNGSYELSVSEGLSYTGNIKSFRHLLSLNNADPEIVIEDFRTVSRNALRLKASLSSSLKDTQGREMPGTLMWRKQGPNGVEEQALDHETVIDESKAKAPGLSDWRKKVSLKQPDRCGLVLESIPGETYVNESYHGTIIWTLEDTP
ncbi:hypothetical protein ACYRFT_00600 [Listeria kieliensis]